MAPARDRSSSWESRRRLENWRGIPASTSGEKSALIGDNRHVAPKSASPEAVALFAKVPAPGNVKTRLQPPLGPASAASLHLAFASDTWTMMQQLAPATLYLYSDAESEIYSAWAGEQARLQRGDDLGARMLACFADLQEAGHERILIVGSDVPSLPLEYLLSGFAKLHDHDAVLGPTADGGYYAVGCRAPHPAMFDGVTWSSSHTREQTEVAFQRLGYGVDLLPVWYDVDTSEDLQRLAAEPRLPPRTRAWLDQHVHLVAGGRDGNEQPAHVSGGR